MNGRWKEKLRNCSSIAAETKREESGSKSEQTIVATRRRVTRRAQQTLSDSSSGGGQAFWGKIKYKEELKYGGGPGGVERKETAADGRVVEELSKN